MTDSRSVLIANRGEIAVRVNKACRELGIKTIQVYSDADIDSLAVKMSDEAIRIGPAVSAKSYLNIDKISDELDIDIYSLDYYLDLSGVYLLNFKIQTLKLEFQF